MTLFSILMILILIGSITVCFLTVWRIVAYNRKYSFPESVYTMLFGMINKEHVVVLYIIFVVLNVLIGAWFILTI